MEPDRERSLTAESSTPRRHRIWRPFGVYPNALLLGAQLLGVVVFPFTESVVGQSAFALFQLAVLLIAVAAVRPTPALSWVSIVFGVPAAAFTIAGMIAPEATGLEVVSDVAHAAFYFYLAYALLRYMFGDREVTKDEVFATGSCFTVLAWGFAYLYALVQDIWGAGQFAHSSEGALDWMQMLFLSFTTMTGTGLSDITPVGAHARSVVMLEQMAGMFYIALVVARVITLTRGKFQQVGD